MFPIKMFLDYPFDIFLTADYDSHESSAIKHQVYDLVDIHQQYGGFPNTYCYENTRINQLWWPEDQIDFAEIGRQLSMEVVTISTTRQRPGSVIPLHRDTFFAVKQRRPTQSGHLVRVNIFLQDWHMGHIIQYDDTVDFGWKKGEGWMWDESVLHLGANAGFQDKYTLQISGFYQGGDQIAK